MAPENLCAKQPIRHHSLYSKDIVNVVNWWYKKRVMVSILCHGFSLEDNETKLMVNTVLTLHI